MKRLIVPFAFAALMIPTMANADLAPDVAKAVAARPRMWNWSNGASCDMNLRWIAVSRALHRRCILGPLAVSNCRQSTLIPKAIRLAT